MPKFARFKQNAPAQPGLNISGLLTAIGDEVGEVSRDIHSKEFSDGVIRDCVDVIFYTYGAEEPDLPTEVFHIVEASDIETAASLLPAWT